MKNLPNDLAILLAQKRPAGWPALNRWAIARLLRYAEQAGDAAATQTLRRLVQLSTNHMAQTEANR